MYSRSHVLVVIVVVVEDFLLAGVISSKFIPNVCTPVSYFEFELFSNMAKVSLRNNSTFQAAW